LVTNDSWDLAPADVWKSVEDAGRITRAEDTGDCVTRVEDIGDRVVDIGDRVVDIGDCVTRVEDIGDCGTRNDDIEDCGTFGVGAQGCGCGGDACPFASIGDLPRPGRMELPLVCWFCSVKTAGCTHLLGVKALVRTLTGEESRYGPLLPGLLGVIDAEEVGHGLLVATEVGDGGGVSSEKCPDMAGGKIKVVGLNDVG